MTSPHRLYLLRHAKSSWDDPSLSDDRRPLAARGVRAATAMRHHFEQSGVRVAEVLCSPAQRARETWAIVAPGLVGDPRLSYLPAIYEASADELLQLVQTLDEATGAALVIGHNPGLAELAARLTGSGEAAALERLRAGYPTAALAVLAVSGEWARLDRGTAALEDFVVAKELPGY